MRCEANGIAIHYSRTGGAKPPIVLVHGLLGSGATWMQIARVLEADFDVIAPDARGHGESSAPERGYRYEDFAADLVALIDRLALTNPIVVGHSMGGMTSAVAANRFGRVVLVDPTFLSPERQREVNASDVREQRGSKTELVAQARARHPHRAAELIELQAEARLQTSPHAFEVLVPPNPDYREVVRGIAVPTLLVIGDDPVVTLEMATELRAINPLVRIAQIENAGHGVPFDQPEQLAHVIRKWLLSPEPAST